MASTNPTADHWLSVSSIAPVVGLIALVVSWERELGGVALAFVAAILIGAVLTAVHHAELIAHRVGEPYGTLVLALAVTVIEAALIVTLMITDGDKAASLARDTVFAAIMIVCNGVIGLCLLVSAIRNPVVRFQEEGANALLVTVIALATLSLVLPTFTAGSPGPTFTGPQLTFAAIASATVYGVFVFVQTVRHRDDFLPVDHIPDAAGHQPSRRQMWRSAGLLVVCLIAVVGLAKTLSPSIEDAVDSVGAPQAVVGVAIALLVLLPETIAAVRAALRNQMQTSVNLALGSALASIGLTIPTIAIATIWLDGPVLLGLEAKEMVLLALTAFVSTITFGSGQATILPAALHLMIFAAFLFLAVNP